MFKLYYYRFNFNIKMLFWLLKQKLNGNDYENSEISKKMLKSNNKFTLDRLKKIKLSPSEIVILLPHCLQEDSCNVKITSKIENCKKCGKCNIGEILKIKEQKGIKVKVATGGTLARIYLKKERPKLVIAVACERDLITGIYDSFPLPIYGIFNERLNGPCYNTKVSVREINQILEFFLGGKK
ncbi:MAG: hypothetical protein B6I28_01045 [Fusobacteriia bacterium 4572_132]|nr:MAG: hypothetical protein B6I28_01045 [Fusobacteriia bacterium 4572_132]